MDDAPTDPAEGEEEDAASRDEATYDGAEGSAGAGAGAEGRGSGEISNMDVTETVGRVLQSLGHRADQDANRSSKDAYIKVINLDLCHKVGFSVLNVCIMHA